MENPHEQQQAALLKRIVNNVSKLNSSIKELNGKLENINKYNSDVAHVGQMWSAYNESVRIHIDNNNSDLKDANNQRK